MKLFVHWKYREVTLTLKGWEIVEMTTKKYHILRKFLRIILVQENACQGRLYT